MERRPTNDEIADVLSQIADLLEVQAANPFRVRAYREGAASVRAADMSLAELVEQQGEEALPKLPNIGEGLAATIGEFVRTGRSDQLARLQGEVSPADQFAQVPGIGPELAERIAAELDIHTLEELEQAAHDGRLEAVEGFGPKRVESVRLALAGLLSGAAQRHRARASEGERTTENREEGPSIETLLSVDADYRQRAAAGELPTIAPHRFNPENEAWLPIMHDEREGWHFTVLYSNTARAHDLGMTHDWVVIYYQPESGGQEEQVTVVTETRVRLKGKRVVRGRERETRRYYEEQQSGQ